MRSAIHVLLCMSFAASSLAGCVGESAPPADLQATGQSLQTKGVYYLQATGTAEAPALTFFDHNKAMIGEGQASLTTNATDIQWRGVSWQSTGDAFTKNGATAGAKATDAAERDTALSVFEAGLDQAFPTAAIQPEAAKCQKVACSRPNNRCTGVCTGFVCSQTDGSTGECIDQTNK